jgi:hypothetical protein
MSDSEAGAGEPAEDHVHDHYIHGDSVLAFITLTKELEGIKTRIDGLEAQKKKKFYQDQSFWIGITAIPIIFASGWLLKIATDNPLLLLGIHRLLGTEPALVAALDEGHDTLRAAIQSLDKERVPALTALLRVGLPQQRAQKLDCSPDTGSPAAIKLHCEVPQDAFVSTADAAFSIGSATKVNVGIVVNVIENVYRDDGYRDKIVDHTDAQETTSLISVAINGVDLPALTQPMMFAPSLSVEGTKLKYARYSFPCHSFKQPEVPEFPMNTITVSVLPSVPQRYSITVGALLLESSQHCTDKD